VALPTGVEVVGGSIRIRFMWDGRRRCETLAFPLTPQGIQAAAGHRTTVIQLAKLGMLTDAKYAELFPRSSYTAEKQVKLFGQFAQEWLNSREIAAGTRHNYVSAFNTYWMAPLALLPLDKITPTLLRKLVGEIEWSSPGAKRNALTRLGTLLTAAVHDGLIDRNPVANIERPKRPKKEIDPFSRVEAELIIQHLYRTSTRFTRIYAAYFEFAFYTGMRPQEIMALRWDEIDTRKKSALVKRVVAQRVIHERTKTAEIRYVLLNERALHALSAAREVAADREVRHERNALRHAESPYVFPPARGHEHIQETSVTDKHFKAALAALGIRRRRQYNCRHTYATVCLMQGMRPAFIARQLGHSVQMLLSRYARWLDGEDDWKEMQKLESLEPLDDKIVPMLNSRKPAPRADEKHHRGDQ
jgi:integrase